MEIQDLKNQQEQSEDKGLIPIKGFKYMTEFVAKIYTNLGATLYHSKTEIAKANGLSANSIKQMLSLGQTFQLLELKHSTGYKITPLFLKIYKPLNDHEKKQSVIVSLRNIPAFNKMLNDYNGHNLPPNTSIANNIARSFSINEQSSLRIANLFIEAVKDFDLLNSDRELDLTFSSVKQEKTAIEANPNTIKNDTNGDEMIELPILLKSKRQALIKLPSNFSDEDLSRIITILSAYMEKDQ